LVNGVVLAHSAFAANIQPFQRDPRGFARFGSASGERPRRALR
jgi:hypothetical protein